MQTVVGAVVIRRDGAAVESETTVSVVDPHVVVFTTAVPQLALLVKTTYVGADDVPTIATDLVLGVRPAASSRTRKISRESIPVTHAREQCLLDHARCVMETLQSGDLRSTVDVSDESVAQAAAM
ncbi:MAG TPA: hypothetical protein VF549_08380 [Solirubrobacteraceae bacterium]|jgi:hypothetical protein